MAFQFSSALLDRLREGAKDVSDFVNKPTDSPEFKNTILAKANERLAGVIRGGVQKSRDFFAPSEGENRFRDVVRGTSQALFPRFGLGELTAQPEDVAREARNTELSRRFQAKDPTLTSEERKIGSQVAFDDLSAVAGVTGGIGKVGKGAKPGLKAVGETFSDILRKSDSRPKHQALIEKAMEVGDYVKARKIAEGIPENDPYRKSMIEVIDTLSPKTVKGSKTGFFRSLIDFGTENSKVLGRLGQSGKNLTNITRRTYEQADVDAGKALNTLVRPLRKLTSAEKANFIDVSEGKAQPTSERVQQLVNTWDTIRSEIADVADEMDLFQRGRRQNYFPHMLNDDWINAPKNEPKVIKHLIDTGQAVDERDARAVLGNIRQNLERKQSYLTDVSQFKSGNLEYSREADLPKEAYESDPVAALTQYITDTYRRINEVKNFGRSGEKLEEFYDLINKEGKDASKARDIMEQILGTQKGKYDAITKPLREYQSGTKLVTAFISNAGQPVNTITTKGLGNTLRSLGRIVTNSDEAVTKAVNSGNLTDDFLRESLNTKYKSWVGKLPWMKAFGKVENFNRILDSNAAEFALNSMVKRFVKNPESKLAKRILETQYGVDTAKLLQEGTLQGDDFLRAINSGVRTSQFRTRAQDLPQFLSEPDAKLFTQFKNFGFKQAQFVMDQVVKEAAQGNPTPLIRYIIAGAAIGELINDSKQTTKNLGRTVVGLEPEQRDNEGLNRVVENILATGGAGLLSDAYKKFSRGEYDVYGWVFGPTVSDLIKGGVNIGKALQGNIEPLEKQALQQIPYVGRPAAEAITPSNTGSSSRSGGSPKIKRRK